MNARVLVVEDEVLIARELQMRLSKLGYDVPGFASSGKEALELAEKVAPDVVLMDIVLKGQMDGIETATEMRKRWSLPIIYLTAYADDHTIERACTTDPFSYILKPFSERDLRVNIEMALYKRDAEQKMRKLEAQLQQAQRLESVGRLAGGVAHDFNNLLTVITGYGDLLWETADLDEEGRAAVQEIRRAAVRAAGLTRQLLAFSGKQVMQPQVLELNRVISDIVDMLRRLIGADIEIITRLAEPLHKVKLDLTQFEQVLVNLVVNARDAMPNGGCLSIVTTNVKVCCKEDGMHSAPPGPQVVLEVSDTGCGMDEATLAQIYEPFFTTKSPGAGTGLGLSTVYGVVSQSNGSISVKSKVGLGTSFYLYFPAIEENIDSVGGKEANSITTPISGRILLATESDSTAMCKLLERRGFEVQVAEFAETSLEIIDRYCGQIDVVVTQPSRFRTRGADLALAVRERYPHIHVVLMYGKGKSSLPKELAGFPLLVMPFSTGTLEETIVALLGASPRALSE